jgi:hypothetical protein
VASDEKFAPNKKTLTYSNIGTYLKRGITLVGDPMKVLHKGCMKQYCVGIHTFSKYPDDEAESIMITNLVAFAGSAPQEDTTHCCTIWA